MSGFDPRNHPFGNNTVDVRNRTLHNTIIPSELRFKITLQIENTDTSFKNLTVSDFDTTVKTMKRMLEWHVRNR